MKATRWGNLMATRLGWRKFENSPDATRYQLEVCPHIPTPPTPRKKTQNSCRRWHLVLSWTWIEEYLASNNVFDGSSTLTESDSETDMDHERLERYCLEVFTLSDFCTDTQSECMPLDRCWFHQCDKPWQWRLARWPPQERFAVSYMICVNTVCLGFSYECNEFSQSLDFPSLACLHMPSVASAHAQ